jgi:Transposase domain (DUF772)
MWHAPPSRTGVPLARSGTRSAPCSRMRNLPPSSLGGGNRACPPYRLALVTILQFREQLSDRQAAEAVRMRSDWKYLLSLV